MTHRVRVLPDNNVWRSLVDSDAVEILRATARATETDIVACPAVAFEMLRTPNRQLRNKLIRAITKQGWVRAMPEVFQEAAELRAEIERLRDDWLHPAPDLAYWYRLHADWKGGWWRRARRETEQEAKRVRLLGDARLQEVRADATSARQQLRALDQRFETLDLRRPKSFFQGEQPGWDGVPFDAWRLEGMERWSESLFLGHGSRAYGEWLEPWLDMKTIRRETDRWVSFWTRDVREVHMPRHWLRWAIALVQATQKTGSGTPIDNQIGAYLLDCDIFLTADKRFAASIEKVREFCPVDLPKVAVLRGGQQAVPDLLALLEDLRSRR